MLAELSEPLESVLSEDAITRYREAIQRRCRGVPVAYITGRREFHALSFCVGPGVLVPRPETETLVEEAINVIEMIVREKGDRPVVYHDCCTGSGCVAIAVVRECLERRITVIPGFSDIEEEALAWACRNARRLLPEEMRWEARCASWLDGLDGPVDLVTANPPYLTDTEAHVALESGWGEPYSALAAGEKGLAAYQELIPRALDRIRSGGYLLMECGAEQATAVAAICRETGFVRTSVVHDQSGKDRVVTARRPG